MPATATVGTTLALLLAWAQDVPFGGRTLVTVLTLSWAIFAVNTVIQFPLLIRFGYTRVSVLATTLPLALVILAVLRLHLHLSIASIQIWLPVLEVAGVAPKYRTGVGGPPVNARSSRSAPIVTQAPHVTWRRSCRSVGRCAGHRR